MQLFLSVNDYETLIVSKGEVIARYESEVFRVYCIETVIRFRLRLFRISLFIRVLPRLLLTCPKRDIFQLFIFLVNDLMLPIGRKEVPF